MEFIHKLYHLNLIMVQNSIQNHTLHFMSYLLALFYSRSVFQSLPFTILVLFKTVLASYFV